MEQKQQAALETISSLHHPSPLLRNQSRSNQWQNISKFLSNDITWLLIIANNV